MFEALELRRVTRTPGEKINIDRDFNNNLSKVEEELNREYLATNVWLETSAHSTIRTVIIEGLTDYAQLSGIPLHIKAGHWGSSNAVTLNINGLGPKNIMFPKAGSNAMSLTPTNSYWVQRSQPYVVIWDGSVFNLMSEAYNYGSNAHWGLQKLTGNGAGGNLVIPVGSQVQNANLNNTSYLFHRDTPVTFYGDSAGAPLELDDSTLYQGYLESRTYNMNVTTVGALTSGVYQVLRIPSIERSYSRYVQIVNGNPMFEPFIRDTNIPIPSVTLRVVRAPYEVEQEQRQWLIAELLSDAIYGDMLQLRRFRRRSGTSGSTLAKAGFSIANSNRRPNGVLEGRYSFWQGDTGLPVSTALGARKAGSLVWLCPIDKFKELRQTNTVVTRDGHRSDYVFMGGKLDEDFNPTPSARRTRRVLIDFIVQRNDQFGVPSKTAGISFIQEATPPHFEDQRGNVRVVFM